uniref:Uncharacterized protein LOC114339009 n=1 Tax=Diabrotica virgifera virgifera TaxID=50390 RepID=A0A6P7G8M0_DIAVI
MADPETIREIMRYDEHVDADREFIRSLPDRPTTSVGTIPKPPKPEAIKSEATKSEKVAVSSTKRERDSDSDSESSDVAVQPTNNVDVDEDENFWLNLSSYRFNKLKDVHNERLRIEKDIKNVDDICRHEEQKLQKLTETVSSLRSQYYKAKHDEEVLRKKVREKINLQKSKRVSMLREKSIYDNQIKTMLMTERTKNHDKLEN